MSVSINMTPMTSLPPLTNPNRAVRPCQMIRPQDWQALLTDRRFGKRNVSSLIMREMLDPISLLKITRVSKKIHLIASAEWKVSKVKSCSKMLADHLLKLIMQHFTEGELKISREEFEKTISVPLDSKQQKIFNLGILLDALGKPIADAFTMEEVMAALKIVQSNIGKSVTQKAIDFEKYQKNIPPAVSKAMNVIFGNAPNIVGNFFFGAPPSPPEPISKDRVSKTCSNKDFLSILPLPVLSQFISTAYLNPKGLSRLARVSRKFRLLVNTGWKQIKNPNCIRFVVERKLDLIMLNLGLEEILKRETVRYLEEQNGMTYIFTGTLSLFISQVHEDNWKNLVRAISKVILPYVSNIIPLTMEESITLVRFANSPIGKSITRKMIPFGFIIDQIGLRIFRPHLPMLKEG